MADVGSFSHHHHAVLLPEFGGWQADRLTRMAQAVESLDRSAWQLWMLRTLVLALVSLETVAAVVGLGLRVWLPEVLAGLGFLPLARLGTVLLAGAGTVFFVLLVYNEIKRNGDSLSGSIAQDWQVLRFGVAGGERMDAPEMEPFAARMNGVLRNFARASDMSLTGFSKAGWYYMIVSLLLVVAETLISWNL